MLQTIEIDLQFQEVIPGPPETPKALFQRAAQNDEVTINSWRDIWMKNIRHNHEKHGPFSANSIGRYYNAHKLQPVIIVGSGPSLKKNIDELARAKKVGIPIVSCLHNFHFLEDNDAGADLYVTLDAGDVTFDEISEGGAKTHEEYLAISKKRSLAAFIGASPKVTDSWQGEMVWYNSPIPDKDHVEAVAKVEDFNTYVSTGGNVLGACFYIARAILGANPVIFTGADFSFSYSKKFHAWDSKYDKTVGNVMRVTDIFGNKTSTWPSYYGFKCWFDSRACTVPGMIINATEGGIFGAYAEGNIAQVRQMALKDVVDMYDANAPIEEQCKNPQTKDRTVMF